MLSLRTVALVSCGLALTGGAAALLEKTDTPPAIFLSDLASCVPVQRLASLKEAVDAQAGESPFARAFQLLFPFDDPAWNSLLATFYISSVPNFLLAAIPADIDLSSLNTLTSFAVGALLGDVMLHLLPHSFLGEPSVEGGVQVVVVEPKRNIIISLAIFSGFAAFFLMEKLARYLSALVSPAGESHGHGHSHSHGTSSTGKSSAVADAGTSSELRKRNGSKEVASVDDDGQEADGAVVVPTAAEPSNVSAYLNLAADFTHNITDGLSMSAAFYVSPTMGATTALACFAHEIPHEVADFSILIKSGFTKWQAMGAQLVTAVGAFVGTVLGIWIQRSAAAGATEVEADLVAGLLNKSHGLLGTSATPADLLIPAVAGSFLYIATCTVIPDLLESKSSGAQLVKETAAMAVGVACMALLSWYE